MLPPLFTCFFLLYGCRNESSLALILISGLLNCQLHSESTILKGAWHIAQSDEMCNLLLCDKFLYRLGSILNWLRFGVLPFHDGYFIIGKPVEPVNYPVNKVVGCFNASLEGSEDIHSS